MSYAQAIKAFADNIRRCDSLTDAKWKPFLLNLNTGLNALATALEKDMSEIHAQLDRLKTNSEPPR
jgi:hypothetical protein